MFSLDENAQHSDVDGDTAAEIENEILKENLVIALTSLAECEQDVIGLCDYYEIPLRDITIKNLTMRNLSNTKTPAS